MNAGLILSLVLLGASLTRPNPEHCGQVFPSYLPVVRHSGQLVPGIPSSSCASMVFP